MTRRLSLALLASAAACAPATDPAADVRVDARVTPAGARLGDAVTITVVATNPGTRRANWSSGCGFNLGFHLRDAAGRVVEAPLYGTCTAELRRLSLDAGASMTETVRWRLGAAPAGGGPGVTGSLRVVGRLGVGDERARPGAAATLDVLP